MKKQQYLKSLCFVTVLLIVLFELLDRKYLRENNSEANVDNSNFTLDIPREYSDKQNITDLEKNPRKIKLYNFHRARNKRFPGAILIGAKKCGTGALKFFLRNHPQIVMAKREEVHFFDKQDFPRKPRIDYLKQFPAVHDKKQQVFEKTPGYRHVLFL